jgi:hypothetical protein
MFRKMLQQIVTKLRYINLVKTDWLDNSVVSLKR